MTATIWPDAQNKELLRRLRMDEIGVDDLPDDLLYVITVASKQYVESMGMDQSARADIDLTYALARGEKPHPDAADSFKARCAVLRRVLYSRPKTGDLFDQLCAEALDMLDSVEMRLSEVRQ